MYVDEPPTPNSPSEHRASTAQRARLLLAQGGLAAAARWTEERGLAAGDEPTYQREREYLVLARVVLAQDRPAQAVALLERLHAAAAAQNRAGSVIETQALRALALAASGEEAGAVDVLAGVLTLACPQGYARVFADEGPPVGALLGRLVAAQKTVQAAARGVSPPCLARLLRVFGQELTARELEILVLLAARMPNPRIAQELVVSLDTVKKHVSHLLGKLGAANAPRPSPGPAARPDPLTGRPVPGGTVVPCPARERSTAKYTTG